MVNPNSSNNEIIQIAEAVSREKSLPRNDVLQAMEHAIQVASRKKYGQDNEIKVKINPNTGEIKIHRIRQVVEEVTDYNREISLEQAQHIDPEKQLGDDFSEPLPPLDIARVAAHSAKQVIIQKIKEAENEKQYEEYKNKVGEIVNATVKRIEFGNVIVDLGRGEGFLRKDKTIRGETFKVNERIRVYIEEVDRNSRGHQVLLSRANNDFLAKLFKQEVPEVYDNIIEIKAVAREPGSKAKVAVFTSDSSIDPVGTCVGVKGSRVQGIINELKGEKIDIIQWTDDLAKYIINALAPAEVSKVVIDEDSQQVEVVVASDHLSLAIGRKGQNVRLASQLTGWKIDVLTEDEESRRRVEEFNSSTQMFVEKLGVEEVLAQLLASEGFSSIDDIAYSDLDELTSIEGLDEELATELLNRAQQISAKDNEEVISEIKELGVDDELIELLSLEPKDMLALAQEGIKSLEDLGELSAQEFIEIVPESGLKLHEAEQLIEASKQLER